MAEACWRKRTFASFTMLPPKHFVSIGRIYIRLIGADDGPAEVRRVEMCRRHKTIRPLLTLLRVVLSHSTPHGPDWCRQCRSGQESEQLRNDGRDRGLHFAL